MEKLKGWTIKMLSAAGAALMNFPAAVAFSLFAALAGIMLVGTPDGGGTLLESLFTAMLTGALANLLLTLAARRYSLGAVWSLALTGLGIALAAAAFLLLYAVQDAGELMRARVIAADIILGLAILLVLIHRPRRGISAVVSMLLKRILCAAVFGVLFFAVGALAAVSVNILRLANVPERLFLQLIIGAAFVTAVFFIGSLSSVFDPDSETYSEIYSATLEKIVSYILIPVVLIFFAVELVLVAQDFIYNNWPSAVDIFGRLATMLGLGCIVHTLSARIQNAVCRFFRLFLPCAGLLLLGVGVWRLIDLVADYGITDKRYFALLTYAFLAICLVVMLIGLEGRGRALIITAMVFTAIAVLPVINYHTVSAFSQMRRAESILTRNGMLSDGVLSPPESISETDRLELSRAVQYLVDNDETVMAPWLPVHFDFIGDFAAVFGVQGEYDELGNSTLVGRTYVGALADKYYNIDGGEMVIVNNTTYNLFNFSADGIVGRRGTYTLRFTSGAADSLIFVVLRDGIMVGEVDVTDQLMNIASYLESESGNAGETVKMPIEMMTVTVDTGDVRVRVVLKSVTAAADKISRGLSSALTDIILMQEK